MMKGVGWFILLSVLWILLSGSFMTLSVLFGMGLSLILTASVYKTLPSLPYRPWITLKFIGFILWALLAANIRVAQDVLRFRLKNHPGIIAFKIHTLTNDQDIWLANMISLTPGTLILDFDQKSRVLFIHVMFLRDRESIFTELHALEKRIMELLPA
jgi:multicomponent Na+:H+ antiporter subunit E